MFATTMKDLPQAARQPAASTPGASAPPPPYLIACGTPPARLPAPGEVGLKACNLMRMAALGLPVPPGFVLGAGWCARAAELTPAVWAAALQALEQASGLRLGDKRRPLLVSVRSGAAVSMPGMMETLLDIGLCDSTVDGFVRQTGNPRLVWDAYRRLVATCGEVVAGLPPEPFAADLTAVAGDRDERELDFAELREVARRHLATFERESGAPFPQDPMAQLDAAIRAVFASWGSDKARAYRRIKGLDDALGTAVTVQRMVFGNAGGLSGAGVGFSRNPSTGEAEPWIDFLFDAQGEDVVSGRRSVHAHQALAEASPALWDELVAAARRIEAAFGDMQDFEFTIEQGRLYLLQARDGKRTVQAAARIALDLCDEGIIDADEAVRRIAGLDAAALQVFELVADDGNPPDPVGRADSASSGVVSGEIALDAGRAADRHAAGVAVVLVRQDAETADIAALDHAAGLLTARGARTSHAAVVARQLGKVCLVGCSTLHIDLARRRIRIGEREFAEGESLTLDANTGLIYAGALRVRARVPHDLIARLEALRARVAAREQDSH